jgi:hypothetical protein
MVMQKTYCKEAIMTVKSHHSTKQLLYLAKKEKNKRLAVRIQSLALAKQGFTCSEIVEMPATRAGQFKDGLPNTTKLASKG